LKSSTPHSFHWRRRRRRRRRTASKATSYFGSNYPCGQTFLTRNCIKTKYKSHLSEADLSESLRAVLPNYNTHFKKFRSQMQCHPSY
jgi:hypothetical protein